MLIVAYSVARTSTLDEGRRGQDDRRVSDGEACGRFVVRLLRLLLNGVVFVGPVNERARLQDFGLEVGLP